MTLLAIDTATQRVSLALHDGDQVIAETTWLCPNQHTRQIPPRIRAMMDDAGITPSALSAVAVAAGPGAYSALRSGIALAKGFAGARALPLVGISTFDITAAAAPSSSSAGALVVVLLAGRARISVARYQWRKGAWKMRGEPENMNWEALLASIDGAAVVTGEIDGDGRARIAQAVADGLPLTILPGALRVRRAGMLAELAWARLRESGADAFPESAVAPVYLTTKDTSL